MINIVKNATVSARVEPELKEQAESILQQLGIPVSVVINTLYHQIVLQNGVPFSMTIPASPRALDSMSKAELNAKLEHSYDQVLHREGRPAAEVFADLERKHA